jgi:Nuclease-related domain
VDRPDSGRAGASARRVHERRRTARQARVRQQHPRIGSVLLAIRGARQSERSWSDGGQAEEWVATHLERRCRDAVVLLHDRRLPGSRANIDHIAVAPSGVWVVDTKRYKGRIRVRSPLIGPAELRIGGRDRTKLVEALDRYRAAVGAVVDEIRPGVPVYAAFCFVKGDLPLFGAPPVNGCRVLHRRSLTRHLNGRGPLDTEDTISLASELALRFPPA